MADNVTILDSVGASKTVRTTDNATVHTPHHNIDAVVPGTGATSLGKAADAVAGATDTGVVPLAIRDDALSALTPIEGDYVPLRVDATGSLYVTGAGGGTQYTEDAAAAANPVGTALILVREDGLAGSLTTADGDNVAARGNNKGELYVKHTDSVAVTGTVTANLAAGTNNIGDVDVLSIAAGDNNIGNVDIVTMPNVTLAAGTNTNEVVGDAAHDAVVAGNPVLIGGYASAAAPTDVSADGDAARIWTTVKGAVNVADAGGSLTVDGTVTANLAAGTNNIGDIDVLSIAAGDNNIGNVDVVSLPASTNTLEVVGDVAHDAAAAGNPVLICGVAQACDDTAPPNRVSAESDATRLATDLDGSVFVRPHGPQTWSYHLDTSTAQTDASVHAAPGAGLSLWVTDIVFSSGAATAINAFFEEGASKVLGPYYLEAVAGRGMSIHFGTPKKITANTALTLTTSASIAHAVDVTGFIAPG